MKTLIVDTSFWIALYDSEDNKDKQNLISLIAENIHEYQVLIPFPTLYEFLNTKFSRTAMVVDFQKEISKHNYVKIDDTEYKEIALNNFFEKSKYQKNEDVSLVDEIIKLMIDDKNLKTDLIITFDSALENYALSKNVRSV